MGVFYLILLALFVGYHISAWRRIRVLPFEPEGAVVYPDEVPRVSILVPAWQAEASIVPFVESFRALRYPDKELILCVGGLDEGWNVATALQDASIHVLKQKPGEGKQGGLAKCFARSSGAIIYLTDIDCLLDEASFAKVLRPILTGRETVVTGSSMPVLAQRAIGAVVVHWALVRKAEGVDGRYTVGILGRNCAVTREAVEEIGGFRFPAPTGTDYRMAQELTAKGHRIWLEPTSEIQTEYAWPLTAYMRKRGRWVRNVLLYADRPRQNSEYYNALSVALLPVFMLGALVVSVVAAQLLPWGLAALPVFAVALLLAHGALNRLRYLVETLGPDYLTTTTIRGAFVNWIGQLGAGLYAFFTWLVPPLRRQW